MIATPQQLGQPFPVTVLGRDAAGDRATNFVGPVYFSGWTDEREASVGDPMSTGSQFISPVNRAFRMQAIYRSSQIGKAGLIQGLALRIAQPSSAVLTNWTIRLKHTPRNSYSPASPAAWETNDWTVVYRSTLSLADAGWIQFPFDLAFDYNGADNLLVDFSCISGSSAAVARCQATSYSGSRVAFNYLDSGTVPPLEWSGTMPTPSVSPSPPDIRLTFGRPVSVTPAVSGGFVDGGWAGSIAVGEVTSWMILRVADGLGHQADSVAFAVSQTNDLCLVASSSQNPLTIGDDVDYLITVTNPGPAEATHVVLTNALPSGMVFVSAGLSQGAFSNLNGTLICDLGTLPAGGNASLTVRATSVLPGTFTNQTTASRGEADGWNRNNTAWVLTKVNPLPVISATGGSVTEGNGDTTNAVFSISLSEPSTRSVTVDYTTEDGTAIAGQDYIARSGTLTFVPGNELFGVPVTVIVDTLSETNEVFLLRLSNAQGATLGADGSVQIRDDDPYPTVSISDVFVVENVGSTTNASLTVTLSAPSGRTVMVDFTTADGSALSGSDYVATNGVLTFPPGTTVQDLEVVILGDATPETAEYLLVNLSHPAGAILGKGQGRATIVGGVVLEFEWGGLPSSQYANLAFPVTLTARDTERNIATNFNGSVVLSALAGSPVTSPVLITEVDPGLRDAVELANLSTNAVNLSGWEVVLYDSGSWPDPSVTFRMPQNTLCATGAVFRVTESPPMVGSYPNFYANSTLLWNDRSGFNPIAVLLRDPLGRVMDFFAAADTTPSLIQRPVSIPAVEWNGPPLPALTATGLTYQRTGTADAQSDLDWTNRSSTVGVRNPGLARLFSSDVHSVVVQPATATGFTNGVWRGTLSVSALAANVVLQATDANGVVWSSRGFEVRTPPLTLVLPDSASEGDGILTYRGAAQTPVVLSSDLVVNLSTSGNPEISLPTTVVVPAGQTNATFDLGIVDDLELDGSQVVLVTASSEGWLSATRSIMIHDTETAALGLSIPSTATEGDAGLVGTITLSAPPTRDVMVSLVSSSADVILPMDVVLPANATTTTFAFRIADNMQIDGSRTATVSARVTNWTSGEALIRLIDNEDTNLRLSLPSGLVEGSGTLTNVGRASISGTLTNDLVLNMTSTDPARLTVPAEVLIAAGQTSVVFSVLVPDNTAFDGSITVSVTINAPGFSGATLAVTVDDNDVHHLTASSIDSPQLTGFPVDWALSARTIDGMVVTGFNQTFQLAAAGRGGPVACQPSTNLVFVAGIWAGEITMQTADTDVRLHVTLDAGPAVGSNPFNVYPGSLRVMDLLVADMVSDQARGRIYASVPAGTNAYANSVVVIDPVTASVEASIPVGDLTVPAVSTPYRVGRLALASEGQALYVAVNAAQSLQRIDVPTSTVGPQFALGQNEFGKTMSAWDMTVQPGHPLSIAVARGDGYNPWDLVVYDDGVQRPNPVYAPQAVLAWMEDGALLVGYRPFLGDGVCTVLSPTFEVLTQTSHVITDFGVRIVPAGDHVFATSGQVVDPRSGTLVSRFPVLGRVEQFPGQCRAAPDPRGRRAFFISTGNGDDWDHQWLQNFEWPSCTPLHTIRIATGFTLADPLLRWGTNGLAFAAGSQIFLVEAPLLFSSGHSADLALTQTVTQDPGTGTVSYTISVTNQGPDTAFDTKVRFFTPSGAEIVRTDPCFDSPRFSTNPVVINLGTLVANGVARAEVVIRPRSPGWVTNWATVVANESDPDLTNNRCGLETFLQSAVAPNSVTVFHFPSRDLAYDPQTRRVYSSMPASSGGLADRLAAVDPVLGRLAGSWPVGSEPGRLALSDDHRFLYVTINTNRSIRRFILASQTPGLAFDLGTNGPLLVEDLKVLPGHSGSVAVSRMVPGQTQSGFMHEAIAVYDEGIARPRTEAEPTHFYPDGLEFGADASLLYALNSGSLGFQRLTVDAEGVHFLDSNDAVVPLFTPMTMEFGGGFLYLSEGRVLDPSVPSVVATLPGVVAGSLVALDRQSDCLAYLVPTETNWLMRVFRVSSLTELGIVPIPGLSGVPSSLIRWGADGLAFRTGDDQLFLVRTAFIPLQPGLDGDDDGMPDEWEAANGLDLNQPADAAADADADGLTNLQEYLAGTDPQDAQSALRVMVTVIDPDQVQVRFASVAGKQYRLERKDDLAAGTWDPLLDAVAGTGGLISHDDRLSPSQRARFYRVRLLP